MRTIRTAIEIDAEPEAVWEVLTAVSAYEEWNPHVTRVVGDLREGGTLEIEVTPSWSRARTMTVRVTAFDPPRRLQWVGPLGLRFLFRGRHTFELRPLDGGRTLFRNREEVSGLLAPVVVPADAAADYEAMNRALAARVEGADA